MSNLLQFVTDKRKQITLEAEGALAKGQGDAALTIFAMGWSLDAIIEKVEAFQAEFDKQAEQLAAIKDAAKVVANALNDLPEWTDVSTPLSADHFFDDLNQEVVDALDERWFTISDLQALMSAIHG